MFFFSPPPTIAGTERQRIWGTRMDFLVQGKREQEGLHECAGSAQGCAFPRVSVSAMQCSPRRWAPWAHGRPPISQPLLPPRGPWSPFPSFTSSGRLHGLPSKDPITRGSPKQVIHQGDQRLRALVAQQTPGKVRGSSHVEAESELGGRAAHTQSSSERSDANPSSASEQLPIRRVSGTWVGESPHNHGDSLAGPSTARSGTFCGGLPRQPAPSSVTAVPAGQPCFTHTHTQVARFSPTAQQLSEAAQSCPTLCDPMDCSPPGSSIHGILQAGRLDWVIISREAALNCVLSAKRTALSRPCMFANEYRGHEKESHLSRKASPSTRQQVQDLTSQPSEEPLLTAARVD